MLKLKMKMITKINVRDVLSGGGRHLYLEVDIMPEYGP